MSMVMLDPEELHIGPDYSLKSDPSIKGILLLLVSHTIPYHVMMCACMSIACCQSYNLISGVFMVCLVVVKVPYKIMDKTQLLATINEEQAAIFDILKMKFLTLYELWEFFVDHTGYDCDIEVTYCAVFLSTKSSVANRILLRYCKSATTPGDAARHSNVKK
jgi:hypothetical protein